MSGSKPSSCQGCSLYDKGYGFTHATGSEWADIAWVGENPGDTQAEGKLSSLLRKAGIAPERVVQHNLLSCEPPQRPLHQPWLLPAIGQCRQHLEPSIRNAKVVITAGPVATKHMLRQAGSLEINNWHGTINEFAGKIVVPMIHPNVLLSGRAEQKYLRGGRAKLTGVALFDLLRAKQVADGTYQHEPASLKVDPDLEWFSRWIDTFIAALASGKDLWLSVDVETEEKLGGGTEDELKGNRVAIVRINFSYNPDEGITVPWVGEYIEQAKRLIEAASWLIFHNWRYDVPLLRACGIRIGRFHDTMNCFKMLQSDLPLGLGFIAPFFSRYPAWKHLSSTDPGRYAAIDAFQTLRIAYGAKRDLLKSGQWDAYMRHIYELDTLVLHPAEEVGLYIDRAKLVEFREQLVVKEAALQAKIQAQVGEDGRPLVSGAVNKKSGFRSAGKGWKKAPRALRPGEELVEVLREEEVYVCTECKAEDITQKHRCPKPPRIPKPRGKARSRKKASASLSPNPGLPSGLDAPSDGDAGA